MYTTPLFFSSRGAPTATSRSPSPLRSARMDMVVPNLPMEGTVTVSSPFSCICGKWERSLIQILYCLIETQTLILNLCHSPPHQSVCRCRSDLPSSPEAGKTVELPPAGNQCYRLSLCLLSTALRQSRSQSEKWSWDKDIYYTLNRHHFLTVFLQGKRSATARKCSGFLSATAERCSSAHFHKGATCSL